MIFDLPPDFPKPAIIRPALDDVWRYGQDPALAAVFMPGFRVKLGPVLTFRGSDSNTANQNSYTFSSKDIGPQAAQRIVAVAVMMQSIASPSSVTIGGVSATKLTDSASNGTIWVAEGVSGTTADIVVNGTGATCCIIGWWTVVAYGNATPYDEIDTADSGNTSGTSRSETVDFPVNGVGFFAAGRAGSGGVTWTGATEEFDVVAETIALSGASHVSLNGETNRTISVSYSSSTFRTLNGAVYR